LIDGQELDLVLDLDYCGGARVSVDVTTLLSRKAYLSVQLARLQGSVSMFFPQKPREFAGDLRIRLSRQPYAHWSMTFLKEPTIEMKVDSALGGGRSLKHVVPVIVNLFRRIIKGKHVLPYYKVQYTLGLQ